MRAIPDCSSCGNYRLVPGDDDLLMACPDCNTPVSCPVHGETVAFRDGVIVGRCWGCVQEAQQAERLIVARKFRRAAA